MRPCCPQKVAICNTGDIIVIDLENGRLTAHTKEVLKGEVVE